MKRVLIANRGEIAVRIIRCLSQMGIESVSIYSDSDSDSLHRQLADIAVPIGGQSSAESYLVIEKIIAAAQKAECDAIHPGYGFLSENAEFSKAVTTAGMIFIGPKHSSIEKLGDKIAARKLAQDVGATTTSGSKQALQLSLIHISEPTRPY